MHHPAKINTKHSEIWVDDEGFLVLNMEDGIEMDLEEVTAAFEAYAQLGYGKGKKTLQLMIAKESATMPPEARKYVAEHGKHFFIASALVGQSLAIRLLVNFFNTFYKHDVPFRMFENEEAARKWLRTFKSCLLR